MKLLEYTTTETQLDEVVELTQKFCSDNCDNIDW